jgi:hypothetical protein
MGMRLRAGFVLLLVVAMPACVRPTRRSASERPPTTASVGQGLDVPQEADATRPPAAREEGGGGHLALQITDDQERHPAGIPVEISGPKTQTVLSDARGKVTFSGPPGFYEARIPKGCHDEVLVHDGGTGKIGLVEGATVDGKLRVSWQHRFGPSGAAFSDAASDWQVGDTVTMTYDVRDHCSDQLAPSGSFPTFEFVTSRNLRIVGTPVLRADRKGRAKVSVVCTKAGALDLVVRDEANPSDRLDLLRFAAHYGGVPECVV